MPCNISWLIEKRIVHVEYHGKVSAEDIRSQAMQTVQLVQKLGIAPVHIFIDASRVSGVGVGLGDLRSLSVPTMPESGWMVIIAPNALYRFFISIGAQVTGGSYKFVQSKEEALTYLKSRDLTLKDLAQV